MPSDKNQSGMSFLDHLEELRWRIMKIIIAILLGGIATFGFIDIILEILLRPISQVANANPIQLQVLSVQGMFLIKWAIAIIGGICIAVPVITYQCWKFIAPGLYVNEKRFAFPLVLFSFISFTLGILFGYFVLIPYSLNFFSGLTSEGIDNNFSINYYFSFIIWILLGTGLIFQLPVISLLLSIIGLLTPSFMRHYRRHSIIVILVLASFITPPDPVSMVIMAMPLFLLYEISIGISWIVNRKNAI